MSSTIVEEGSEAGSNTGATPRPRRTQRRATVSGQSTDTTTRDSESQDVSSGLILPFLARISRGRLNVSEASIPAPRSSEIMAHGQVFTPTHEHFKELVMDVDQAQPEMYVDQTQPEERGAFADPEQNAHSDETITVIAIKGRKASTGAEDEAPFPKLTEPATTDVTATPADLTSDPDSARTQIANILPNIESLGPLGVPHIRVHRPSGTIMPPSFETSAVNSDEVPATPVQSLAQSPAGATTISPEAIDSITAAGALLRNGPVDAPTNSIADRPNDASTTQGPVEEPNEGPREESNGGPGEERTGVPGEEPNGGPGEEPGERWSPKSRKRSRRKRMLRKARKIVIRKSVLKIMLGRELANDVHPRLNRVNSSVAATPQSLDGASDLPSASPMRDERRRDARQRQLDRKVVVARVHARAEGLERCPSCHGPTKTACLHRFHRLELKCDRPDMSVVQRHAAASAKVATVQCECLH
ncbi:hypothetical protein EDD36DRAFT_12955 [Exophiala viscosa]|uniref:Uncharacterized protein n=2 Tax=Exophiala viscosa TaxID=2486360 RepID=A0AAN6IH18_9EURO|nr:hypothetical protein EDD36DRAFT_12955 [Exophiala viscosa]